MKLLPSELNPSASRVRRDEFETTDSPIHDKVVIEKSSVCEEENLSGPQDNSCEYNIINTLSSSSIARVEQVHSPSSESGSPLTVPLRQALSSSSSASLAGTSGTSTGTATSPLSNPLVMAGLVPGNLADILSTSGCEDLQKKPKRKVFKARVLTEQEFFETLKNKEQKEAEMEEMKEQRRIQREQKKKERERHNRRKHKSEELRKEREESGFNRNEKSLQLPLLKKISHPLQLGKGPLLHRRLRKIYHEHHLLDASRLRQCIKAPARYGYVDSESS